MPGTPILEPLPKRNRRAIFILLLLLFVIVLPFLYLYATGYRFEFGNKTNIVSTGGMYIAAERTGAEIFIDGELVRETRVFRKAFYAQNLEPGTHEVHVQKEGHNTWVKELPVIPHLVTEAQAFNLPLVPDVRIISKWQSATGSAVVKDFILHASSTNEYIATTTKNTKHFSKNAEYASLLQLFSTTTATSTETLTQRVADQIDSLLSTSTATGTLLATTTKEWLGVRLFERGDGLFARWVGSPEDMPYYYCAEPFPPYSSSTASTSLNVKKAAQSANTVSSGADTVELMHPVQSVPKDKVCDPVIQIHTQFQTLHAFDFFPGSTDLVLMTLDDGIYVIEIDNRAWQNVQPLLKGENLNMKVENGQIYVYDGELIYQVILEA